MRKPRDIDAELKALSDKQKQLKARRIVQLGEIVAATSADSLDPETLAGVLLDAIERVKADVSTREAWQRKGAAFFRRERRSRASAANSAGDAAAGTSADISGAAPVDGSAATG